MTHQCAILVGGRGTRLGQLTAATPKPLLPVAGRPFVDVLVSEAVRHGFDDILLLAGYRSPQISEYVDALKVRYGPSVNFDLSIEPEPLGTGGAVWFARDRLDESFLLLNGDSWFDFNWLDLTAAQQGGDAIIAVREVEWADRYESLRLAEDGRIEAVVPRGQGQGDTLSINAGVYRFEKQHFAGHGERFSLEADLLPRLAERGQLFGRRHHGYFIDIGLKATYESAQFEVPTHLSRPAIFFDRDGVLNIDHGYVGSPTQFEWVEGAQDAIRLANDCGYFAFVVTNQAGIARGYYDESAVLELHQWIEDELFRVGAHIDDWRFCPFHPDGVVEKFTGNHPWRKPNPGMINDLLDRWPVCLEGSLLIGDQPSDLLAAERAGIRGLPFEGGNLLHFLQSELNLQASSNTTRGRCK